MHSALICALLASLCHQSATQQLPSLVLARGGLWIWVEPWGNNSLRVRSSAVYYPFPPPTKGALELIAPPTATPVALGHSSITNGNVRAVVIANGLIQFEHADGNVFLRETSRACAGGPRASFASSPSEAIYGLGEHQRTQDTMSYLKTLNWKGVAFDMAMCLQYNVSYGGAVCIPFIYGAQYEREIVYGFLWNNPGLGNVTFGNETVWVSEGLPIVDYFVTTHPEGVALNENPEYILRQYLASVGGVPSLPYWATGYWHSKNRYSSQAEILTTARRFVKLSIPIEVIVIDYLNWAQQGDWAFDPMYWPNPGAMIEELNSMGIRVMVSAWPFCSNFSDTFQPMFDSKYCATDVQTGECINYPDGECNHWSNDSVYCLLYDPTLNASASYVWSRLAKGYYNYGVKIFWLDAAEPENVYGLPPNAAFAEGTFNQVVMKFPYYHTKMVHEGLRGEGEPDDSIIMLARSAWAGSQQWRHILWSGDTNSTFANLKASLIAGMSIQMSGHFWWTTDIGGYTCIECESNFTHFEEVLVRWFQFGMLCPIFRQHGLRNTEPWAYGNRTEELVIEVINQRYQWREYISHELESGRTSGRPLNRPLFWDFPWDSVAWPIVDQMMFGTDYMASPILESGAKTRAVYLPILHNGQCWRRDGMSYEGGQWVDVTQITMDDLPLWKRSLNCP